MTRPRHHADDVADALIQVAVKNPFDRRPRLILADRLDEVGEPARAEFIRLSCDPGPLSVKDARRMRELWVGLPYGLDGWINWFGNGRVYDGDVDALDDPFRIVTDGLEARVRNGMVEEVTAPLAWLIGADCEMCLGVDGIGLDFLTNCLHCGGTGRTPGHLADVVARHPVTKVVVTDREPHDWYDYAGFYCWERDGDGVTYHGDRRAYLPPDVFDRLLGGKPLTLPDGSSNPPDGRLKTFPTREAAVESLSRALVDLARKRAGVPAINWPEVTA